MNNTTTTTKHTQDYTDLGYGFINTYYVRTVYQPSGNVVTIKHYTCTVNGVESKRFNRRGNATNLMFKLAGGAK